MCLTSSNPGPTTARRQKVELEGWEYTHLLELCLIALCGEDSPEVSLARKVKTEYASLQARAEEAEAELDVYAGALEDEEVLALAGNNCLTKAEKVTPTAPMVGPVKKQ